MSQVPFPGRYRRPVPLLLLLLLAFAMGIVAERAGLLPGPNRELATFWQVWRIAHANYVDRSHIDDKHLVDGATAGMVDALGDVGHTAFLTRDEWQRMQASLEGRFEGIGALMGVRQRRPIITQTLPNSPARRAGLKAGDVIVQVDGKDVDGLSLDQIVQRVRGPAGTQVRLTILRGGESQPREVTITRGRLDTPDATWWMLPGTKVAHVALREFGKQADAQLKAVLEAARKAGAAALIIDVRGNPGGLKDQAVDVTSGFLHPGEVVFIEQDAAGRRTEVPVLPEKSTGRGLPTCLLIDEGTASSAEIFAGALQDYGRARLVGTRTFGTGTVLQSFGPLHDGAYLLLAIAQWLTPKGRQIWHHGIPPDVPVELPQGAQPLLPGEEPHLDAAGLARSQDKQLLRALDLLWDQKTGSLRPLPPVTSRPAPRHQVGTQ
jgi:carboxyl-terminal processing protease